MGKHIPVSQEEWQRRIGVFDCEWLEEVPFAYSYRLARCKVCKHEFKISGTILKTRTRNTVCPECLVPRSTGGGIYPHRYGYLYLMVDDHGAMKVGITCIQIHRKDGRVAQHERHGWRLHKSWSLNNGHDAYKIEQLVLNWWRNELKVLPAYKGTDGWTETARTSDVSIIDTCNKIEIFVFDLFVA